MERRSEHEPHRGPAFVKTHYNGQAGFDWDHRGSLSMGAGDPRPSKQPIEIKRPCKHLELAFRVPWPLFFRSIPIQLDAISVRIAQIKRFTDAMVGCAFEWNVCFHQSLKRVSEFSACRIEDCQMIQTGMALRRGRTARAFPRVQADMMVVTAG